MRNGSSSRWTGRANLFGNGPQGQAPVASAPLKRVKNLWKAPVTLEYLQALREADELVFSAILRGVVLRHSARVLKA
jgi:hypothetical protein